MYARVNTIEGSPDRMDDVTSPYTGADPAPAAEDGRVQGFVALGDRQSGKLLGVAFWESEEALRATEEAVSSVRSGAAEAAGGIVAAWSGTRSWSTRRPRRGRWELSRAPWEG
jgi:hypothetical protein